MKNYTYTIIGNSVAAVGAVEAIRSVDRAGSMAVISDETHHVYSRPLITHYLAGEVSDEKMLYRPSDFYERNSIDAILGVRAESVDFEKRRINIGNDAVGNDKLLIATGGSPIVPDIPGTHLNGVFTMNTWDDARRMKEFLPGVRSAVVLGGGFTGLKTAEALVEVGLKVTIVELSDRILSLLLDRESAKIVTNVFEEHSATVLTGRTISNICGEGEVESVSLDNGEKIDCRMVVLSIGVRPRLEIVQDSAVKLNRGVLVDRKMETSVPGVFAAGDVAEAYDALLGRNRVLPVLPNAYAGGRTAGLNMADRESIFDFGASVNSTTFFGYPIVSAGFSTLEEDAEIIEGTSKSGYRRFVLQNDKLAGFVIAGDIDRAGLVLDLLRTKIPMNGLKERLVSGISLMDLPEELRNEKLTLRRTP